MKKLVFFVGLALFLLPISAVRAGSCYETVTKVDWTGTINSGVFLRDLTCMEESVVLETLVAGSTVHITGEADGWYQITLDDGTTGFVWNSFISVTDYNSGPSEVVETEPEEVTEPIIEYQHVIVDESLPERVKGYILLQVESAGEAWYVRSDDGKRYYMKDGATAYEMMRYFGLGISNSDLEKVLAGDSSLVNRLKGEILLQVEAHGEAYYIHPKDGSAHYLKDGEAAYQIMRELSLGITNSDLSGITVGDFDAVVAQNEGEAVTKEESQVLEVNSTLPASVNLDELNTYWLSLINDLRSDANLSQLVIDNRWVATATEWANYMGSIDSGTHDRPDGKSMHQWIDTKGLDFTIRYSDGGWQTNYFTENISWGIAQSATTEDFKQVLDDALAFYLSEASYNGVHYRTIYHEDWNSVGLGLHATKQTNGTYKVYAAFHYGSLNL